MSMRVAVTSQNFRTITGHADTGKTLCSIVYICSLRHLTQFNGISRSSSQSLYA